MGGVWYNNTIKKRKRVQKQLLLHHRLRQNGTLLNQSNSIVPCKEQYRQD